MKTSSNPYKPKHNSNLAGKILIRESVISELGLPLRVLETHSGPGAMRRACYQDAVEWLGCDADPKSPDAIHCDSRLLLRAINLDRFTLFDIDPFGGPFEHLWIVSQRWKGERLGLALTCGQFAGTHRMHSTFRHAGWSRQMCEAALVHPDTPFREVFEAETVVSFLKVFLDSWFKMKIEKLWSAISKADHSGGITAWYFGVILQR
jgi:hypothetical protein